MFHNHFGRGDYARIGQICPEKGIERHLRVIFGSKFALGCPPRGFSCKSKVRTAEKAGAAPNLDSIAEVGAAQESC
jgi:hypothetical protein